MANRVILLAHEQDLHADAIADGCARRGLPFLRVDPCHLTARASGIYFTINPNHSAWSISTDRQTVISGDEYAVYCREWDLPSIPSVDNLAQSVATEESLAFLHAWAQMLPIGKCTSGELRQLVVCEELSVMLG
jgi:hypothetical protein